MRTPIAHALAWPERIESGVASLDLIATARLDFSAPDYQRFPCLALAETAAKTAGTAPAILNAANEVAVEAFLNRQLGFNQIAEVIAGVMEKSSITEPSDLSHVQFADQQARQMAGQLVRQFRR